MRRASRGLYIFTLVMILFSSVPHRVRAADQNANRIADGLRVAAVLFDTVTTFEELGEPIPLTSASPSSDQALRLSSLFQTSLRRALDGVASYESLEQLRDTIDQADLSYGGVDITFNAVTVGPNSQNSQLIDVGFTVQAHRTTRLPIALAEGAVSLRGGGVTVELGLAAALTFQLDSSAGDPNQPSRDFYLTGTPALTISIATPAGGSDIGSIASQLGFTTVTAGGMLALDSTIVVQLSDPDSDGRISEDEWLNTALADLAAVTQIDNPATNAVAATLTLDSPLIPGTPDGALTYSDSSLTDGLAAPSFALGALADFTQVSAIDVLNGLNQLVAGLAEAQSGGNPRLPLIKEHLGDAFAFVEPLLTFMKRQGEAAIVCGTTDTIPPRGDITQARAGDLVYCQAITVQSPASAIWSIPSGSGLVGANTSDEGALATIGTRPTANAQFKLTADGDPHVQVDFTDADGTAHNVGRRFTSAQDLLAKLAELGGFTDPANRMSYDPATRSLYYRLVHTADPRPLAGTLDIGDQLSDVNLTALSPAGGASAMIDPQNVTTDLTLGVLLVDQTVIPAESVAQRFFLQADPDPAKYAFQADAPVTATLELQGRIGFLEVAAQGHGAENTAAPGTVFAITRHDPAQPMLGIRLSAPGFTVGSGAQAISVPRAVQLPALIERPADYIQAHCNMDLSSGIMVSAALGSAQVINGGVTVDWSDAFAGGCQPNPATLHVQPSASFAQNLQHFDIDPMLRGQHTDAASSESILIDSSQDFGARPDLVGTRFHNTTDGSVCVVLAVDGNHLTCPLSGGIDNRWEHHDTYRGGGNPLALLGVILDHLDELAQGIDTLAGSSLTADLDRKLPLIEIAPRQLLTQFSTLRALINDIRTGTAPQIVCGTANNGADPPSGSVSSVADGTLIACQATTPHPARDIVWSIHGGSAGDNTSRADPETIRTVGTNPGASATFTVGDSDPATGGQRVLGQDYRIHLEYIDAAGRHVASYPELVPTTLQQLERTIEAKLGIPDAALAFALRDLPAAGSTSGAGDGVQDLVVNLGYAVCTEANTIIGACQSGDRVVSQPTIPLNVNLGDRSLVELDGSAAVQLEYAARARLDLAVPLPSRFSAGQVAIIDTSGVTLVAGARSDNLALQASVGSLAVVLGKTARPGSAGMLRLGAGFSLAKRGLDSTPENQTFAAGTFISDLAAQFQRPATQSTCGQTDPDGAGGAAPLPLDGDACAKLTLTIDVSGLPIDLGEVDARVADISAAPDDLSTYPGWYAAPPPDLEQRLADLALDWTLLLEAARRLTGEVQLRLDGAASRQKVPLIGNTLDAGANVAGKLHDGLGELADLSQQIQQAGDADGDNDIDALDVQLVTQQQIYAKLGPASQLELLRDRGGDGVTIDDIGVQVLCATPSGAQACADGTTPVQIDDMRITMLIGQDISTNLPFDIGLNGLPLRALGNVQAGGSWSLLLDFGLSRASGPYLMAQDPAELQLSAAVRLGETNDPACNQVIPDAGGLLAHYSPARCLRGELGFLQVILQDGADDGSPGQQTANPDDDRTQVGLQVALDVRPASGGDDRLTFAELARGQAAVQPTITAGVNVDLRFRTGFAGSSGSDLPSIVGSFHFTWALGSSDPGADVSFKHLHLDAGQFTSRFLQPILSNVRRITSPLQPVIDTVRAPVPVLSKLADLTGRPPVTLFSLMEARARPGSLRMVKSLIGLVTFINRGLPADSGALLIPLDGGQGASFSVDVERVRDTAVTPDQADKVITRPSAVHSMLERLGAVPGPGEEGAFNVPGLAFPFLEKPSLLFGLLLGKDITLVRYDPGPLSASVSLPYSFPPIMIGPVPVVISVNLTAAIEGRIAIGYDTAGLRATIKGGTADKLINGIFIDDYDAAGVDVPEIRLTGRVTVAAAADFVILAIGVEGGVELNVYMNLNDDPKPDGKLRIEEIAYRLSNPSCLFDISGDMRAFLNAFARVGVKIFGRLIGKTFKVKLVDVKLFDFTVNTRCPPQPVQLAYRDSNGDLRLRVGTFAGGRGVDEGETNERFVVRQLNREGTRFSVSAFGAHEEVEIAPGGRILADAGDGNDTIALAPGVDDDGAPIPFTAPSVINGGSGNDRIDGGSGADQIEGGDGEDQISGGSGDDTLSGGAGDDVLDGESGSDILAGDDGDDVVNGGAGADRLDGGANDDTLLGGLGAQPTDNPDLGDTIIGGVGSDIIDGSAGDDRLYGDAELDGGADGPPDDGADQIIGGEGNDLIRGGAGSDILGGGSGDDTLDGNAGNDTLDGDDEDGAAAGHDTLRGGAGNDMLDGRGGDDTLDGGDDSDTLTGNDGTDTLTGGAGDDMLTGGAGNDTLDGAAGNDLVQGGDGDDTLTGGEDNDTLRGDGGDDTLNGGDGSDILHGDSGSDNLHGGGDADTLRGGIGGDTLSGDEGDDTLRGDGGDDTLNGGTGSDTIDGGTGSDRLDGNDSADLIADPDSPIQIAITQPADGTRVAYGAEVTLSGTAVDQSSGPITDPALLNWSSSRDGTLGSGPQVQLTTLSAGTHKITFNAANGRGQASSATITLIVDDTIVPPPPNDAFSAASPLSFGVAGGTVTGATTEADEMQPCGFTDATVWYRITATSAGEFVISAQGSGFDPVLAIYQGNTLANLAALDCPTATAGAAQTRVPVTAGATYYVQIGGTSDDPGNFTLQISLEQPAPFIWLPSRDPSRKGQDACTTTILPRNDDGSTGAVPLGFAINFFGVPYDQVYVNNNGNVTFGEPLSTYTPFGLQSAQIPIIAPFFADVDTRNSGSDPVTYSYGDGIYAGRNAFCVNWLNVGYYNARVDKLNSFQLVLVDRSDLASGDFDIYMNYLKVTWETGDASGGSGGLGGTPARMGYSNGSSSSFELPGSGISGAFLDSSATGLIHNSRNSIQPGRYLFEVRNGAPPTGGSISGTIFDRSATPGSVLAGAFVQTCGSAGFCQITTSNASGQYTISGLASGQYSVTAFPPAGSNLMRGTLGPLTISESSSLTGQDIVLAGPLAPPAGTTITSRATTAAGVPMVYWNEQLTLTTQGCTGGSARYELLQHDTVVRSGTMTEGGPGTYTANLAPLQPLLGTARLELTINCPDSTTERISFDVYIDPSGWVRTVTGVPVPDATVTLYRADSPIGPFTVVPDGSAIMSPMNRTNPDQTDSAGHFGWDVLAGFYKVRAERDGCTSPTDPAQLYVESHIMTIPPPVTDLDLRLDCPSIGPRLEVVGSPAAGTLTVRVPQRFALVFDAAHAWQAGAWYDLASDPLLNLARSNGPSTNYNVIQAPLEIAYNRWYNLSNAVNPRVTIRAQDDQQIVLETAWEWRPRDGSVFAVTATHTIDVNGRWMVHTVLTNQSLTLGPRQFGQVEYAFTNVRSDLGWQETLAADGTAFTWTRSAGAPQVRLHTQRAGGQAGHFDSDGPGNRYWMITNLRLNPGARWEATWTNYLLNAP